MKCDNKFDKVKSVIDTILCNVNV